MRAIKFPVTTLAVTSSLLQLAASCLLTGSTVHLRQRDLTNDTIQRRWSHMEPGDPGGDKNDPLHVPNGDLWPGNTLVWCFGDTSEWGNQLNAIRADIEAAWKLWVLAGVDAQTIIFKEGDAAECHPDNTNVLDVWKGPLLSTVGYYNKGNKMSLSDSATTALGDRVANFAHEIGHAWGMLHEHQRNNMWQAGTYVGGRGYTNTWIFHCENVDGYDDYTYGVDPKAVDEMCHDYTAAKVGIINPDGVNTNKMNLDQWLPGKTFWQVAGPAGDLGYDPKSIMLYPSTMGGYPDPDNGWKKRVVYTTHDGKLLPANTTPSVGDAEGLSDMYPKAEPDDRPCLLGDDCNSQQASFRAAQGSAGTCSS